MLKPTKFRIKSRSGRKDAGYVLITLMLFVTLLVIAAVAAIPELKFQIQRDREEEMVHRGVQYTRAIRRYYKKFGTYPANMDLLESSNNVRFLRKRYKDPINGQAFKILHFTDVKFFNQQGIAGAQTLGQPIGTGMGGTQDTSASGTQDPNAAITNTTTAPQATDNSAAAAVAASTGTPTTTDGSQVQSGAGGGGGGGSILPFAPAPLLGNNGNGNSFGGAGIVGVSSTSPKDTIRVFNKKTHYNEWQFVYDPTSDRGGMVTGPYQPSLQSILPGQNGQQTNQPGNNQPFNNQNNNSMQPNNDVPLQQ